MKHQPTAERLIARLMSNDELRDHIESESRRRCGHNREAREDLKQEAWMYLSVSADNLDVEGYKNIVTNAMRVLSNQERKERTEMFASYCERGSVQWSNWNPEYQRLG